MLVVVDCGPLPELENGVITLVDNRTTHGALADYVCKENYTLLGDVRRRCGDGGIWSGHQPQCLCKKLILINILFIITIIITYNITYYFLVDWCSEPPQINGGVVTNTGRRVGSTATYSCQNGFILFGDNVSNFEYNSIYYI